jgi:acyl carrier protein
MRQRLIQCFSATFPGLSEREIVSASTDSVGDWDSVMTVTLAALVEEEFDVAFAPEEIASLTSFAAIERKLREKAPG